MRFQLPGSSDWLEASGEIARISESKKEAGLRFVDLSEDTRNRIKNWVSSAESPGQWQRETVNVSEEKKQPAGPPPTRTVKSATAEFAGPDAIAHEKAQGSMSVPETDRRSRGEEGFVASRVPREEPFAPDNLAQARDPLQHSDRRVHVRRPVPSLAYVDFGENNGGIILNIGEGGLAVTSVAPLYTDVLVANAVSIARFQRLARGQWRDHTDQRVEERSWFTVCESFRRYPQSNQGLDFVGRLPCRIPTRRSWSSRKGLAAFGDAHHGHPSEHTSPTCKS